MKENICQNEGNLDLWITKRATVEYLGIFSRPIMEVPSQNKKKVKGTC